MQVDSLLRQVREAVKAARLAVKEALATLEAGPGHFDREKF